MVKKLDYEIKNEKEPMCLILTLSRNTLSNNLHVHIQKETGKRAHKTVVCLNMCLIIIKYTANRNNNIQNSHPSKV
jgi:hypothetical protein